MIVWDEAKNRKLRDERGICFEQVVEKIMADDVVDILEHRGRKNQRILVVSLGGHIHAVPYLVDGNGDMVLKTVYPSRKLQRRYGQDKETGTT